MDFFVKRKPFTYFILVLITISGVVSVLSITKESFPEITVPVVAVQTVFPGASAFDVEDLVTNVLEEPLVRSLSDVKEITSFSLDDVSFVIAEFETTIEINDALQDVRDEIDIVKGDLPEDAEDPIILQVGFSDIPVFITSLSTRSAFTSLSEISTAIEDRLLDVRGVAGVEVIGLPDREVTVILSIDDLKLFNLNPTSVLSGLGAANISLPAGTIEQNGAEFKVTLEGRFKTAEDVLNTIVEHTSSGEPIYVRDIGIVEDGLAQYQNTSRLSIGGENPQQSITFAITKQVGYDVTVLAEDVEAALVELEERFKDDDVAFFTILNDGETVFEDIRNLSSSAMQTIILVFIVLLLGLGFRESVLAAISVPLSFLVAFVGLILSGNTINFISLFALIMAIGLLVDSSVVITEGMSGNLKTSDNPDEAASKTIRELMQSIVAGTLTTIAVFLPLLFLSGITGLIIAPVPETITIVLLGSLVVAIFFIPVIGTSLLKRDVVHSAYSVKRDVFIAKVTEKYRDILDNILTHKNLGKRIVLGSVGLLVISLSLVSFGLIKVEFFPEDNFETITITVTTPPGYPLAETGVITAQVEDELRVFPHIEAFVSKISPSESSITVTLDDDKNGKQAVKDLREKFSNFPDAEIFVSNATTITPPFEIKFSGDDWAKLTLLVKEAQALVETIPGTLDVDTNVDPASTDIDLLINREQVAKVGLDVESVAIIARTALFGTEATTFTHPKSGDNTSVVVKTGLNPSFTSTQNTNLVTIDALKSLPVQTPVGEVLLGSLFTEEIVPGTKSVDREDGKRTVTVTSFVDDGFVVNDINAVFLERIDELLIPEGITFSFGGDTESGGDAMKELAVALMTGILLIIGILIFQFNSVKKTFFIVSVIPLGLVGVLFGLFIFGQTLSFPAMLGFVALVGIVINNSIILIDVMGALQARGGEKRAVVLDGAATRLRPILLTTTTTVLGMIPLLFTSPTWTPFALSVIMGLSFAVVLTLIIIPLFYYWWG